MQSIILILHGDTTIPEHIQTALTTTTPTHHNNYVFIDSPFSDTVLLELHKVL